MNTNLLKEAFQRVKGMALGVPQAAVERHQCEACLDKALNLLVEETDPRVRFLPNYQARLRRPVIDAFTFINDLVDGIPGAVLCSRSTYVSDPRTNAFFSSPDHISEVFSSSREVREFFKTSTLSSECWGLLCMRKNEVRRPGVDLQGGELRREVMQTYINFSDHQFISPGQTEEEARQALKCCIFKSLVAFIQREIITAKKSLLEQETRQRVLSGRIRTSHDETERVYMQEELSQLKIKASKGPELKTLTDYFEFIRKTLQDPKGYVSCRNFDIHVSRMGVKISEGSTRGGLLLPVTEIEVASHIPRIAALAGFPREELLPEVDFAREANLFLAM